MSIHFINKIKAIESRLPMVNSSSLRSIREDIDHLVTLGFHTSVIDGLRNQLWNHARFQGLI